MRTALIVCGSACLASFLLGHWLADHDLIAVALLRRDPLAAVPLLALLALRLFSILVAPTWLALALIAWGWARRAQRG